MEVRGHARIVEDDVWLHRQISDLTDFMEKGRVQPWAISDAPNDFISAQKKAIVGIEIPVMSMEGKWKMSQNRSDEDREGVVRGLSDPQDPHSNQIMADIVADRIKK